VFKAVGKNAKELFLNESGGHRWQRVPPNEKRGRVHTSTVTVAVLFEPTDSAFQLKENELIWTATRGSGPGGQHRNKTNSAVILTHIPTGIRVRVESERSQSRNLSTARGLLRAKLWSLKQKSLDDEIVTCRREQIGTGMRGDKRRTIRMQDGIVKDHISNKTWPIKQYLRGEF